jgi:hypothetical protein
MSPWLAAAEPHAHSANLWGGFLTSAWSGRAGRDVDDRFGDQLRSTFLRRSATARRSSSSLDSTLERFSKVVLALEAVVLLIPTFLGITEAGGWIVSALTGAWAWNHNHLRSAAVDLSVLLGLLSGWRLAVAFFFQGRAKTRRVARPWWFISSALAVASVLVLAFSALSDQSWSASSSPFSTLKYGVIFLPSYLHLSAEVWLRAV